MKINLTWNDKMGCRQFNVDPIDTCQGRPCYESCYAQQGVRFSSGAIGPRWKDCTKSWNQNYGAITLWQNFPEIMIEELNRKKDKRFRWFSAGDCPEGCEKKIAKVMINTLDTTHLVFTKSWKFHEEIVGLRNVRAFFSLWPDAELNEAEQADAFTFCLEGGVGENFAAAIPQKPGRFEELLKKRIEKISMISPVKQKVCPGKCDKCGFCWSPFGRKFVMFRAHGMHKSKIYSEEIK